MGIRRRDFLTASLATGVGVAAGEAFAGDDDSLITVEDTRALRNLPVPRARRIGACVLGYWFAGDGGGKMMYWDPWSRQAENNGTVIASVRRKKGRWLQLHQGEIDFRQFGIFNGEHPADTALDAMVNDPNIHSIKAHTNLNFIRRHKFTRSDITLNFGNNTITVIGIEQADPLASYLGALLHFTGTISGDTLTTQLSEPVPELSDIYPTDNSRDFTLEGWYRLESGRLKGRSERIIQRLVKVTERIGEKYVRVNYKTGYAVPAGDVLSWTPVTPVENVCVINMVFKGSDVFADNGAQPLALEYAVGCNVANIQSTGSFWPVIFRRWNTVYRTEQCSLINPPTTGYGGAGYLTQQIYCLYGHINDCNAANARHLNDFTASSYCRVENCHATGDSSGAFTTHGQYEHDLIYQGNSGILSIANSGFQWGLSARRIRIEQHVCTILLADTYTSELSLTDVHILRASNPDGAGILRVNTDGLQMQGCQIDGEMTFVTLSQRSLRTNLISGCGIKMDNRHDLTISHLDDSDPYIPSHPPAVFRNSINGAGALTFAHCHFIGSDKESSWWLGAKQLCFSDCQFTDLSLQLNGLQSQKIIFSGSNALNGAGKPIALISRQGQQTISWKINGISSQVDNPEGTHIDISSGENRAVIRDCEFSDGRCLFNKEVFPFSPLTLEDNLYQEGSRVEWLETDLEQPKINNLDENHN